MRNRMFEISIISSIFTILFLLTTNLITSSGYLWFVYPSFILAWWPVLIYYTRKNNYKRLSIFGAAYFIVFFVVINLINTPNYIWFMYPAFLIIWWPIAMYFGHNVKKLSIVGSTVIIILLIAANLYVSPNFMWFIYPVFVCLFWPLSAFLANKKHINLYSLICSLLTIALLLIENLMHSPSHLWSLYAIFPILVWPVVMYLRKKVFSTLPSIIISVVGLVYYYLLNTFVSPSHPWILYLILPFVYYPVSTMIIKKISMKVFSYITCTVFILYYSALNYFVSPEHPWVLYLLYPISWLIISTAFLPRKQKFVFAVFATLITAAFCTIMNFVYTPSNIWFVFPIFMLVWWPLSVYFFGKKPSRKAIKF